MKKFQFKLESVLKIRKQAEQEALIDLQEAESQLKKILDHIASLEKEILETETSLRSQARQALSAQEIAYHSSYIQLTRVKIEKMQDNMLRAKNNVEEKRQIAVKAMQERKMIEKLKEKRYSQWEKEIVEKERSQLDEIGTMRHSKKIKIKTI